MKLVTRLTILFAAMFAAFLGALGILQLVQRSSVREMRAEIAEDKARQLARAIAVTGATLERFVSDYTQWDEMCAFVASRDPDWAVINIDQSLASWNFQGAWVFDTEQREVYRHLQPPFAAEDLQAFPDAALVRRLCGTERLHFFAASPHGPIELRTAPIHPSDDQHLKEAPRGWFVVMRLWDQAQFAQLGQLTESTVGVAEESPAPSGSVVESRQILADWSGQPVHSLVLHHRSPLLGNIISYDTDEVVIFLVVGLTFLGLTAGFLHRWVRRPLTLIESSLADESPERTAALRGEPDVFGRIATLILSAAEQRRALRHEAEVRTAAEQQLRRALAERTALGRDLHDGVIQSIYATGMTLQGVGPLLQADPREAQRRIDSCVEGLNRTIAQIRHHIAGLEEGATAAATLPEGLQKLLHEMRLARPVGFDLQLDPLLAAALTEDTIVQLLFIAREAVSNAIRHGLARHIAIHLGTAADELAFTVKDDGIGFDPTLPPRHGHGLDNMTRRAEEIGAALAIESVPGLGTRIRVELPWSGLKSEARDMPPPSP